MPAHLCILTRYVASLISHLSDRLHPEIMRIVHAHHGLLSFPSASLPTSLFPPLLLAGRCHAPFDTSSLRLYHFWLHISLPCSACHLYTSCTLCTSPLSFLPTRGCCRPLPSLTHAWMSSHTHTNPPHTLLTRHGCTAFPYRPFPWVERHSAEVIGACTNTLHCFLWQHCIVINQTEITCYDAVAKGCAQSKRSSGHIIQGRALPAINLSGLTAARCCGGG